MRIRSLAAGLLTLAASAAMAADPSPFVGEWHWNKTASTSVPGEPLPREVVLNIASADRAHVQWTLTTVDDKGASDVQSFTGTGDGKPITGSPDGATRAFTVTPATLDSVYRYPDGGSDSASCSLSADRKKLTCRGSESDGKGHSATYVDVYDRK